MNADYYIPTFCWMLRGTPIIAAEGIPLSVTYKPLMIINE